MVAARELEDGELEEGEITGDENEQVGPASLSINSSHLNCRLQRKLLDKLLVNLQRQLMSLEAHLYAYHARLAADLATRHTAIMADWAELISFNDGVLVSNSMPSFVPCLRSPVLARS